IHLETCHSRPLSIWHSNQNIELKTETKEEEHHEGKLSMNCLICSKPVLQEILTEHFAVEHEVKVKLVKSNELECLEPNCSQILSQELYLHHLQEVHFISEFTRSIPMIESNIEREFPLKKVNGKQLYVISRYTQYINTNSFG